MNLHEELQAFLLSVAQRIWMARCSLDRIEKMNNGLEKSKKYSALLQGVHALSKEVILKLNARPRVGSSRFTWQNYGTFVHGESVREISLFVDLEAQFEETQTLIHLIESAQQTNLREISASSSLGPK